MGLVSGKVQKVTKPGLLVREVLGQQRQASAGDAGCTYLLQETVTTGFLEQNFWELY